MTTTPNAIRVIIERLGAVDMPKNELFAVHPKPAPHSAKSPLNLTNSCWPSELIAASIKLGMNIQAINGTAQIKRNSSLKLPAVPILVSSVVNESVDI
jgi:hypothetical protein